MFSSGKDPDWSRCFPPTLSWCDWHLYGLVEPWPSDHSGPFFHGLSCFSQKISWDSLGIFVFVSNRWRCWDLKRWRAPLYFGYLLRKSWKTLSVFQWPLGKVVYHVLRLLPSALESQWQRHLVNIWTVSAMGSRITIVSLLQGGFLGQDGHLLIKSKLLVSDWTNKQTSKQKILKLRRHTIWPREAYLADGKVKVLTWPLSPSFKNFPTINL